jgi:hypothetical protein
MSYGNFATLLAITLIGLSCVLVTLLRRAQLRVKHLRQEAARLRFNLVCAYRCAELGPLQARDIALMREQALLNCELDSPEVADIIRGASH